MKRKDEGVQVSFAEIRRDVEDGFDELKKMETLLLEDAKKRRGGTVDGVKNERKIGTQERCFCMVWQCCLCSSMF